MRNSIPRTRGDSAGDAFHDWHAELAKAAVDKAQHQMDRHGPARQIGQRLHRGLSLTAPALEHAGAVATVDEQPFAEDVRERTVDALLDRPLWFFASITNTPLDVTTMWSMLPFRPGYAPVVQQSRGGVGKRFIQEIRE